jgi:hypothetical protein
MMSEPIGKELDELAERLCRMLAFEDHPELRAVLLEHSDLTEAEFDRKIDEYRRERRS